MAGEGGRGRIREGTFAPKVTAGHGGEGRLREGTFAPKVFDPLVGFRRPRTSPTALGRFVKPRQATAGEGRRLGQTQQPRPRVGSEPPFKQFLKCVRHFYNGFKRF